MAGTAPTNVAVSNYSATQQRVSWFNKQAGPTVYNNLQVSVNGGAYVDIAINGKVFFSGAISVVYINCSSGQSRRYRIRHYNSAYVEYSEWAYSATVIFQPPGGGYVPPDPTPPQPDPTPTRNPPTNLRITALADTSISLAWQNNQSYPYIILGTYVNGVVQDGRGWWTNNPTSFTDTLHPKPNRLLQYYILVEYAPGDYGYSNHVYIRTTPAAPVNAKAEKYGNRGTRASWTRPTNWDKTWQWLDVQRWDNVGGAWTSHVTGLSPNATDMEDYEIHPGRLYRYRVRARANTGSFERVSAWATTGYIRLMSVSPKIGEAYKDGEMLAVKVGSQWLEADGVWLNVGGVWKPA